MIEWELHYVTVLTILTAALTALTCWYVPVPTKHHLLTVCNSCQIPEFHSRYCLRRWRSL